MRSKEQLKRDRRDEERERQEQRAERLWSEE